MAPTSRLWPRACRPLGGMPGNLTRCGRLLAFDSATPTGRCPARPLAVSSLGRCPAVSLRYAVGTPAEQAPGPCCPQSPGCFRPVQEIILYTDAPAPRPCVTRDAAALCCHPDLRC